jgi:hypothetical protein
MTTSHRSIISPFITDPRDMHGAILRPPLNKIISFCQHDRFRLRFVDYSNATFIFGIISQLDSG